MPDGFTIELMRNIQLGVREFARELVRLQSSIDYLKNNVLHRRIENVLLWGTLL